MMGLGWKSFSSLLTLFITLKLTASFSPLDSTIGFRPRLVSSRLGYTNDNEVAGTPLTRITWQPSGYNSHEWEGRRINYIEAGDPSKPALLLIHGFGASAFHWRNNIPELAERYHVFAFDMLGFGLSSKPVDIDYTADVWRDQTVDFIDNVIGKPTTVAGNSLGGFTALYAASTSPNVNGCVLLNAAGRYRSGDSAVDDAEEDKSDSIIRKVKEFFGRLVINASFIYTKQPARIEQVLKQVYPIDPTNVDKELVESIQYPSTDPNAAEVFYRVITNNGNGPRIFVDDLIEDLEVPLALVWGKFDPWIGPQSCDKIEALGKSSSGVPFVKRYDIEAGHCPHDETPEAVNNAMLDFLTNI